jgi:tetratricopeptide (TPR) repeat protein
MVRCTLVLGVLWAGAAFAQEEVAEMSTGGLLGEATRKLSGEEYFAAIPYMKEYLERMKNEDDPRILTMMQAVRLTLGKTSARLEDSLGAVDYLKQYTETLPCYKPREAYKFLAVNLYKAVEYEQSIAAVTNALARPLPKGLREKTKQVDYSALSKDERAGLSVRKLERYEKESKERGENLSSEISGDVPDPEPDYSTEELVLLNMTIAESYAALAQFEESIEPYKFVIENAAEEDRRGYATMQLINSLVSLKRFDEAADFIVQLSRTNARYNIRVNMAMMTVAAVLLEEGEYDSALMLYRMVLPRQELIDYQEKKMNGILRDAGLLEVILTIVTNETGRLESHFKQKSLGLPQTHSKGQALALPPKPMSVILLEDLVGTLLSLPPYENEVLYRIGELYSETRRPWEAVVALTRLANRDPDGDLGQRAFAESLLVLIDPLKEYERVEILAKPFLERYREGLEPRMVAYALTTCYQKQKLWKEIKQLLPVLARFVPSDSRDIRQYECELYFMQANADLMRLDYGEALASFARVLAEFSGMQRQEDATYSHAMCQTFLKKYEEALSEFSAYQVAYPQGSWLPETVFNSGICLFGLDRMDEAQQQFTRVIETWPEEEVYPDACSLRGDLLASKGLLDEAQRDYEEAIATARNPRQDTYAVFQMVTMFNLEKRYPEIIDTVQAYLARRNAEADVAKAAYWIGKIKMAQGLTGEALAAYQEAVVNYGGDIQQEGVDLIVEELATVAKRLSAAERVELQASLRAAADTADNVTLKLRLRVLLARIDGSELELGKELIVSLTDLTQAPPAVLAVICNAAFAEGNYSRAGEVLTIFQKQFENSDLMRNAYKLRGYDLYATGDLDAAMKIVEEAQSLYGTQPDVVWAQLMKGRIELQREEFDVARKTFQNVLSVRDWRGEPYAEATYYLGIVEETAGDPRKAFGWYQRTYFQYKGYAKGKWAAEGYLASARCLQKLGLENDRRNTFRAMLFDKYVNQLPQAEEAKAALGIDEVMGIGALIAQGVQTNLTVMIEAEEAE